MNLPDPYIASFIREAESLGVVPKVPRVKLRYQRPRPHDADARIARAAVARRGYGYLLQEKSSAS